MWRLIVKHPIKDEVLNTIEGKSLQKIVKILNEQYDNNFITYNKLDNIKCGRNNALPFLTLERICFSYFKIQIF